MFEKINTLMESEETKKLLSENEELLTEAINETAEFPNIHLTMIGPDKGDGSLQLTTKVAQVLGLENKIELVSGIAHELVAEYMDRSGTGGLVIFVDHLVSWFTYQNHFTVYCYSPAEMSGLNRFFRWKRRAESARLEK